MYIKVSGLYIGQGAANLVEIYENKANAELTSPKVKGLVLLDCGSAGKEGKQGGAAVNEPDSAIAVDYIKKMISANNGKLDALVLSHLDSDHINRIIQLTGQNKDGVLQSIGKTLIGGTSRGFRLDNSIIGRSGIGGLSREARSMIEAVKKICTDIRIFSIIDGYVQSECNFLEFKSNTLGIEDSLGFRILANRSLPSLKANDDMYINGNSAVVVAEYSDGSNHYAFLFPGDATVDTYEYINNRLKTYEDKYSFLQASQRVLMLPHHGAVRTSCRNGRISNKDALDSQLTETKAFAEKINATHIYASAHYNAKWYAHPNADIMDIFAKNAEASTEAHENFGFRIRTDAEGKPIGTNNRNTGVSYGLYTLPNETEAYTAHALKTGEGEEPFKQELVSYRGSLGGRAFHVTDMPKQTHIFRSLIYTIDNGAFNVTVETSEKGNRGGV